MDNSKHSQYLRPLNAADLDRVIAIDAAVTGRPRRGFFEKRLAAALRDPRRFVYTGYADTGGLHGFMMCRLSEGEFGGLESAAALDGMGVDPGKQGMGIGHALLRATQDVLRHKGVAELHTQADWRNGSVLAFFRSAGFMLAPRCVLEREVGLGGIDVPVSEPEESRETDFSDPSRDDYAALSRDRIPCRSLQRSDLAALVRIDRKVLGRDRSGYYERKLAEVLDESGIRVSLAAEVDGMVSGFIMARVDFGEFGRAEPYAVLDTMSVDPGLQHRRIATALLSQLLANLTTL
ncbi:MAG: GNAT family N-acetyltransferase, partial [Gammaproteobacteria bacterium]|nr:GNAT family N-acetyltransferase [Gammaproteobacteria bacterium]